MADDEKTPNAEGDQQPENTSKKGVLPLVLIVIGAVLGGAGVAFLAPHGETEAHAPPPPDIRVYVYPETMVFTFNPLVDRGHKQAKVAFRFVYKADRVDVEPPAEEGAAAAGAAEPPPVLAAIRDNWHRAYSRCLEVLAAQKANAHLSPRGKRRIKAILMRELSDSLFPDQCASVQDVLWEEYFVQ